MGIRYVCDWANDDQPYRMNVPVGDLYSLPVNITVADTYAHWYKRLPIHDSARMVTDTFDTLYREGSESGRLLVWHVHAWLLGQPWRSKYFDAILSHMCRRDGVWKATGDEIVDWYSKVTT